MTALGIYAFDGPTLKLCLADPGQKRPDGFGSTGGRTLIVYKRRTE